MAKQMTSTDYIREQDFEGAKERFDKANRRWKSHWFEVCREIAEVCKKWAKKYVFDPINLTIEKVKRATKGRHEGKSYVYLIEMYANGIFRFLKGGKANDVNARMSQLCGYEYKREGVVVDDVKILRTWELADSHLAESFEQALHSYLSKKFRNIPNDRYDPVTLTEDDFAELNRRHAVISAFA